MDANDGTREAAGIASVDLQRWLAVSEPLPVDDDPAWDRELGEAA